MSGLKILGWTVCVGGPDDGWIRHTDCPLSKNVKTPDQDGPLVFVKCMKCGLRPPDRVDKMWSLLKL